MAVVGSKLEGTGFEKLQMVQTHVAEVVGGGSDGGPDGPSEREGEPVLARPGAGEKADALVWREARFKGFGTRVIFAEDLRKPA